MMRNIRKILRKAKLNCRWASASEQARNKRKFRKDLPIDVSGIVPQRSAIINEEAPF